MSQGKLAFNVIFVSSEDASHPVANLHSSLKGWLSGKFPETPQEIILQPTSQQIETLHEIQFLTSSTIPAPLRIDVFIFSPDNEEASQEALQLSKVLFEKVGSIQFSESNNSERNGVQIKSAYMTHEFFLLKLVMYGHQQLRDNVFNQIGLQGLYLIGQSSQLQTLNLRDELKYSHFILQKLNAFSAVRQRAIEIEDFIKAGAVNEQMKQIRAIGDAAMEIIQLKEDAARNGNYLKMSGLEKSLNQIQAKLDLIKEAQTQKPNTAPDRINYYQQTCSEHEMMPLTDDMILTPPVSLAEPSRLINERQEKFLLEQAHKVQAQLPYMDPVAVNNFELQQMQISANKQKILRQGSALSMSGEAVIQSSPFVRQLSGQILNSNNPIVRQQSGRIRPAGANIYNQQDAFKSPKKADFQMAQPVQHTAEVDQDYIQNVQDFFQGDELPRQLFNPEWKLREQAIRAMEKVFIQDQNDDAVLFEALIRTTAVATKDKIAFVVHSALEVCANVLQLRLASFKKQIAQDQVDLVIENIVAKAADVKLKTTIFKLATRIVKHPSIGATKLILKSTEPSKKGVEAKLQLLAEILASLGDFQLQQYQRIVTFAISQLSSSVNKVKELGYTVLVHLYANSPQETRVIIETSAIVRTPQKSILLNAFKLVDQQKILEALDSVQTMKHAIQSPRDE